MKQMLLAMIQNTLQHWGLTDYVPGRVTAIAPLQVSIDDRLRLTKEHLIFTTESQDWAVGDPLVLLRVQRGQKYIVLAKAVGA